MPAGNNPQNGFGERAKERAMRDRYRTAGTGGLVRVSEFRACRYELYMVHVPLKVRSWSIQKKPDSQNSARFLPHQNRGGAYAGMA
jgi:hypothetical protein